MNVKPKRKRWVDHSGRIGRTLALFFLILGCSSNSGESNDSDAEPLLGSWIGETLDFTIDEYGIHTLVLDDFGCTGEITPAGFPLCDSLLSGPFELETPAMSDGESVRIETPFGLRIDGQFDGSEHFNGTVSYTADNGCCETNGTVRLIHEGSVEIETVLPCHTPEQNGAESVWLLAPEPENNIPVSANMEVPITPGFQGGLMLLFQWEFTEISMGGDMRLEMEFESTDASVRATATTRGILLTEAEPLDEEESPDQVWTPVWLVLLDGESGQLLGYEDLPSLEGTGGLLRMAAENLCGFRIERTVPITLVRDPSFEP